MIRKNPTARQRDRVSERADSPKWIGCESVSPETHRQASSDAASNDLPTAHRSPPGGSGARSGGTAPPGGSDASEDVIAAHLFPVGSPENPDSEPLVYVTYQHNPDKHWSESSQNSCLKALESDNIGRNVLKSSPASMAIYPHGFSYRSEKLLDQEQPDNLKETSRGEIKGFSKQSASRLREFMLTHHKEGAHPFAVTLTTQGIYEPAEWETIVKRFRSSIARKHPDWAACWRVELQRRKTPHLHCVFWLDQAAPAHVWKVPLTRLWIAATKEDSVDVWKYSVHVKDLADHDAWMIYCTLHDSKSKQAQLGWKGRQWGIWNRKAWDRREPLTSGTMTERERVEFMRRLRAYSRRRYKGKLVKPLRVRFDSNLPAFVCDSRVVGQLLRGIVPNNPNPTEE